MASNAQSTRLFALAVLAALALALLPGRLTRWLGAIDEPAIFLFGPVAHPVRVVASWFSPPIAGDEFTADHRAALRERDEAQVLYLNAQRRITDLEKRIEELQQGIGVAPGVAVRQVSAAVIASVADPNDGTLLLNRGRREGVVARATVAVARGVNLVGRIIDVGELTSSVLPITRLPEGEWIGGAVMTPGAPLGYTCQLEAIGGGLLQGDLHHEAAGVEPGQIVRLLDDSWPESAQMLVIGVVEKVAPKLEAPLRKVVTVRPQIPIERISDAVLRTPRSADLASGGGR